MKNPAPICQLIFPVVFLSCLCSCQIMLASPDSRQSPSDAWCSDLYSLKKSSVVHVDKSQKLGGRLLNATMGLTSEDCLRRCCSTPHCTVAAFQQQGRLACYLFDCGDTDDFRCEMVPYADYEVAILTVSRKLLYSSQKVKRPAATPLRLNLAQSISHMEDIVPSICSKHEFQCRTSGECIARYDRCNGAYECPDRSDEDNCVEYQQEQHRLAQEMELKEAQRKPIPLDLEDDLRSHGTINDDLSQLNQGPQLWDRGRNRMISEATPTAPEASDHGAPGSGITVPAPARPSVASINKQDRLVGATTQTSTNIPLDRISTTISIISSANPHDIQQIHIEKDHTSFALPFWLNFSDPSHFVLSVVLILTIGFCIGTTLYVLIRCICMRKPKVTKYRIVDPEAEDFLLGDNYG